MAGDGKINEIEYQCLKCGETDTLKWWADDPQSPPPMINCWSCHAGVGEMDMGKMIGGRFGMAMVVSQPAAGDALTRSLPGTAFR